MYLDSSFFVHYDKRLLISNQKVHFIYQIKQGVNLQDYCTLAYRNLYFVDYQQANSINQSQRIIKFRFGSKIFIIFNLMYGMISIQLNSILPVFFILSQYRRQMIFSLICRSANFLSQWNFLSYTALADILSLPHAISSLLLNIYPLWINYLHQLQQYRCHKDCYSICLSVEQIIKEQQNPQIRRESVQIKANARL
ncbi:hypothetical protein FGO68_gene14472 [Halteria grandinella]|uniref:Transmembrane protein n=1 Tax=Halteria grandinella TaxID=5974 RepID=A0A8J8NKZ1_HALGN|nr:hypothetical protein FGO68_gene14472 [Halteria grandinella]